MNNSIYDKLIESAKNIVATTPGTRLVWVHGLPCVVNDLPAGKIVANVVNSNSIAVKS